MRDIRLEEVPFEFDGRTFLLRCNMNVLADVQERYGGSIGAVLEGDNTTMSVLSFLTAMMNDYADEQGWPEQYTEKQVGRRLPPRAELSVLVMGLVRRALIPDSGSAETPSAADNTGRDPVSAPDTETPQAAEPPGTQGN